MSTNTHVACNSIGDIGQAIRFDFNCMSSDFELNTIAPGTSFCYDGFVVDWNAITGTEFNAGAPLGNIWTTGNFQNSETFVSRSFATNSVLYLDPAGPPTSFPPPAMNLSNTHPPYIAGISLLNASGPIQTCPDPLGPPHHSMTTIDTVLQHEMDLIVEDSMKYDVYIPQTDYMNKQWVYNTLTADSTLMEEDSILHNFYDSASRSNMGTIYSIHQLILQNRDTAAQLLNNSITPVNTIELNQLDVNNIFFNTLAVENDSIPSQLLDTLTYIANQCPWTGGGGVYEARSILDYFRGYPTKYIDLCSTDEGDNKQSRLENKTSNSKNYISANVFPNPANSMLNIEVSLQPDETATICLYNSIGERVKCETLSTYLTTMSTSDLAAGIYYYRITDKDNNSIKADKIMITH